MESNSLLQSLQITLAGLENSKSQQELFSVSVLAKKADELAKEFSYDSTVVGMRNYLRQKQTTASTINRCDLNSAYKFLETANNKFAVYFSQELGQKPTINTLKPTIMATSNCSEDLMKEAAIQSTTPETRQAMASLFNDSESLVRYSQDNAIQAKNVCQMLLSAKDLTPNSIKVVAGNSQAILCQADYLTPKGPTSVVIPVELLNKKTLIPDKFFSTTGLVSLNYKNLEEHIVRTAGQKNFISPTQLLNNFAPPILPEVDTVTRAIALNQLNLKPKQALASNNLIQPLMQREETFSFNSSPPKELKPQIENFANFLEKEASEGNFMFGQLAEKARNILQYKLNQLGIKQAEIYTNLVTKEGITFSVKLSPRFAFKVPVKIDKVTNKVQEPKVILASGQLEDFSMSGINLLSQASSDLSALSLSGNELQPVEILAQLEQALFNNQFKKAEELIKVLRDTNDSGALKVGVGFYQQALRDGGQSLRKQAMTESKCTRQVKTANSQYMFCGHTNLPLHKVVQDSLGECVPMYHQHLPENNGPNNLISHKVFWS